MLSFHQQYQDAGNALLADVGGGFAIRIWSTNSESMCTFHGDAIKRETSIISLQIHGYPIPNGSGLVSTPSSSANMNILMNFDHDVDI